MGLLELKQLASALACFVPPVTALVAICIVLIVMLCYIMRQKPPSESLDMPGPFQCPLIGCMYLFRWSSSPQKTLAWLSKIYGNVYSLNLGGTNVVIVNSMESIKDVLYQKSRDFAGRPQLFSFSLWGGKESFMVKDYNSDYLQQKYKANISLQELLNREEWIVSRILKAVQSLNDNFGIHESEKSAFDPDKNIRIAVADLVMDCLFGPCTSRLFYHEARVLLEQASTAYINTAYVGACIDFVSVIRYFSKKKLNSTRSHIAQLRDFVRKVYQVHLGIFLQQSDHTASLAYILRSQNRGYREHQRENLQDTLLDDDTIVTLLAEIMFHAYEKISTCFGWCVARLAANPSLQREIQQELSDNFLRDGTRLLTATIHEVLRTSCALPFGIPRRTTRDTTLNGYKIPQNTIVFLNLYSCCNDAQQFSNPHEFNPYRYISSLNGEAKSAELFPLFCCFGGGERKCLGDTFAKRILVAFTGGVLKEYDLELATPRTYKKLEGTYGLTVRPSSYTIYVRRSVTRTPSKGENNDISISKR